MTLEFTKAAVKDLQSIRNYTLDKWGPEQEQLHLDSLWNKLEKILNSPTQCRSRDDLFPGCKIASEGRHVILFRVKRTTLQIVRILHGAMDYRRHIPKRME